LKTPGKKEANGGEKGLLVDGGGKTKARLRVKQYHIHTRDLKGKEGGQELDT